MEGLLVMAGLVLLAIPAAIIVLLFGFFSQKRRLEAVERQLAYLGRQLDAQRGAAPLPEATEPEAAAEAPRSGKAVPQRVAEPLAADVVSAAPPPLPHSTRPQQPSPIAEGLSKLGPWLQENWFYVVSAVSLALAGVFLVQYGMENGLLPPRARVLAGLAFGAALIGVGEYIRRRFGDGPETVTAYLPSVFSGAGIVTLFGAVLSARMLYDLIGGTEAMIGMVVVAFVAMVLGWLHGPLLVAIGVIGAYGAPVVLGSSNTDASPLFGYFATVAALGLGVDTIRRWGWISALTLVLAYLSGWGLLMTNDGLVWAAIPYFTLLAVIAILIPARGMRPDHRGATMLEALFARRAKPASTSERRPNFPTVMAFGAVAVTSVSLLLMSQTSETEIWLSMVSLAGLAIAITLWSGRARALQDVAMLPAAALLISVWVQGAGFAATYGAFKATYTDNPEAGFPLALPGLVVIGALVTLVAAWRSLRGGRLQVLWAVIAGVYAPSMAILMEVSWAPAEVVGNYPWALHAAALAALMVGLAERFVREDGTARLRTSFAVMSALSCIAFAFVIVLSAAALTVALAVTVVAAAALDRRWNLAPLSYFISAGVVTLGYRLVVDPGLTPGRFGPLPEMILAYGGTLAAFVAALWLLRTQKRPTAKVMLDSAAWSTAGMLVSLLLLRAIDRVAPVGTDDSHWALGIMASVWLGLAMAQMQRAELGGPLRYIRWVMTGLFALIGAVALLIAITEANPMYHHGASAFVFGPPLFNTLAAAYLMPALVLLAGAVRLNNIERRLRIGLAGLGAVLTVIWVVLVIRHFWQGGGAMALSRGVGQPELYSYTIGLLVLGALLFYQSLARRAALLRRAGLLVIGLAVAKVFFIDISGLEGLTRVFSLLVLGLSLAALAWLNRWAQTRDEDVGPNAGGRPPVLGDDPRDI